MLFITSVNAVGLALGATLAFLLLARLGIRITGLITPAAEQPSARAQASRRVLGWAIGQALSVTLVATLLLRAGLSLGDIGLTRPAPREVWGAALVLALLVSALLIAGPLRGSATLREWGAYRVSGGLLAGLASGFGEEIVFRGFVMTALAWGGYGSAAQVLGSGVLFGVAYLRWGALGPRMAWRAGLGAAALAAAVGALYGLLYAWGGRSLLPLIACHTVTDAMVQPALLEAMIARQRGSGV